MIHPAQHFSWSTLQMLNKQSDNIQPWYTPLPILNHSIVSCLVLTVASWPAHRFLRRQVRWSGIPVSLRIFHSFCNPHSQSFPLSSVSEESACNAGDPVPSLGQEDSPGGGNGNSLQYSCLENPMDRGAWQAIVYGVARIGHDWVTKHTHSQRL